MDIDKIIKNKKLSLSEQEVLTYIVTSLKEGKKQGVREIAEANFTSTSTVMRLAKKLGYSGFLEMQYHLQSSMESKVHRDYDAQGFIDYVHFDTLLDSNTKKTIEQFIDILYQEDDRSIFIYATGFSGIIAEYLYKKLIVLGKRVIFSNGTDSIGVFENSLSHIHTVVLISKSGETQKVLEKAQIAKDHDIQLVLFTNEKENSATSLADLVFKIEDTSKLDDRNLMPNTFFPKLLLLIELLVYEFYRRKNNGVG